MSQEASLRRANDLMMEIRHLFSINISSNHYQTSSLAQI